MNDIEQTERESIAIKLAQQASDNMNELRAWIGEIEQARINSKRHYSKKEDRTLASKYIIEYHKGDEVTEEVIRKSIEDIETMMITKSLMYDQILVYTPSETIVCSFKKGKKISYTMDYVTGE